jgi:hypothetical protein
MSAPMPKTLSSAETTAKIIAFPTRPWWATAPNPGCLAWCEVDHDPTEFATSASFVCEQIVAEDERFLVLARSTIRAAQSDGTYGSRSSGPFVVLHLHEPTDADMLDLMAAHARAGVVCETSAALRS